MSKICIVGAGAVSPQGFDLVDVDTASDVFEVPAIPAELESGDRRARKLMGRAAHLASIATRTTLMDAKWSDCDQVGFFMGVGASSPGIKDLTAILGASYRDGELSMKSLGEKGLRSFNPLHTFMLLPNFTMCHSALIEKITGPNGVYFSRGTGTVVALMEASHSVESGACQRALCGAADSALHPLTTAEFRRDGRENTGLMPSEGAAVLALAHSDAPDRISVDATSIHPGRKVGLTSAAASAVSGISGPIDSCFIVPWGEVARASLQTAVDARWPGIEVHDLSLLIGESLAASPALAWTAAVAKLRRSPGRIAILSAGIDGDVGLVVLARERRT